MHGKMGRKLILAGVAPVVALAIGCGSGSGFCDKHSCISNFDNGQGSIVQCADGMWSHSGGRPGACSGHGGESGWGGGSWGTP
jgi:hypothetical protein